MRRRASKLFSIEDTHREPDDAKPTANKRATLRLNSLYQEFGSIQIPRIIAIDKDAIPVKNVIIHSSEHCAAASGSPCKVQGEEPIIHRCQVPQMFTSSASPAARDVQ